MNTLLLDIGNSRGKYRLVQLADPFENQDPEIVALDKLGEFLFTLSGVDQAIVSCVDPEKDPFIRSSLQIDDGDIRFLLADQSPISLNISSPESLGADRLAAAIAAHFRLEESDRDGVVIDCGTAITVDWLNRAGEFEGGTIFPGIETQLQSLAARTKQLPEFSIPAGQVPGTCGNDTRTAIEAGVFWSVVGGIERILHNLVMLQQDRNAAQPPLVLWTGGSGQVLQEQVGVGEYVSDLVLEGLFRFAQKID